MSGVKGQSRQARAASTRRRMLDAAYGLFAEQGYRATTMQGIAERAGVAVQTLYFTFHTKDELLQAVQDRAVLGDGDPVPPPEQPWFLAMMGAATISESIRHFAIGIEGISARVAPLLPTLHEVAGDPAGAVWRNSERLRREGFVDIIAGWTRRTKLRSELDPDKAVDLLLALSGPAVYRELVVECGWPRPDYIDWLTATLLTQLFADGSSGP